MPVSCTFFPNGVLLDHTGDITDKMLIEVNERILAHEYDPDMQFQIMNLAGVASFDVSPRTMLYLAEMDKTFNMGRSVFACVIAPDDLPFGMSRIWSEAAGHDHMETGVFRTLDEGLAWLRAKGINVEGLSD